MKYYFTSLIDSLKIHRPFVLIFFVSLFLRAYRLGDLTSFGIDQGVDFLTIREMVVNHKWTLIGIKTSIAPFFQGPIYLYILYPFFVVFGLLPIAGAYAALFISALTSVALYITINKYFSRETAIFSSLLFAVSPEIVTFGNTPLYQHFLPLLIIVSFYFFLKRNMKLLDYILLGFSVGVGMELHFLNITLAVSIFIYYTVILFKGIKSISAYIVGLFFGLLPTIVFEMRHNFLNTQLLLDYLGQGNSTPFSLFKYTKWFEGTARMMSAENVYLGFIIFFVSLFFVIKNNNDDNSVKDLKKLSLVIFIVTNVMILVLSDFYPQYALPYYLGIFILLPVLIIKPSAKRYGYMLFGLLIVLNFIFSFGRLQNTSGYNMPDGLTLNKIEKIGEVVAEDSKLHPNFNIASLLDGGTRGYPFRYSTTIRGQNPASVTDYPNNNFLYIAARSKAEVLESNVWEVKIFMPFEIGREWNLGNGIYLYRLDREINRQ